MQRSMLLIEVVDGLDKLGANTLLKCQTTWSFYSFYHLELFALMSGCKYMLSDMHRNRELKNQDSSLETRCSTSRLRYSPPHLVSFFFFSGVVDTLEKCSAVKHHFPLPNIAITLLVVLDSKLCHFNSKPINHKEDTLNSFMAFDITPHGLVFRVVVESQIVAPPTTIPPSQ